jgi:hypothetical protein
MKKIIAYIVFLFQLLNLGAQEPFMFHYSVKDGLPSKEVHAIFQDSKSYIWVCTDGGIARYNANTFKIFSSAEGLPDNTVFEILEDKQGRLWFRTFSGGVGYIVNDSVHLIPANEKIVGLQNSGLLQSFAIDESGTIWLGRTGSDECYFIKVKPPYRENDVEKINGESGKSGIDVRCINSRLVFAEARLNTKRERTPYLIIIRDENNKIVFRDSIESGKTQGFSRFFRNGNEIVFVSGKYIRHYDLKKQIIHYSELPGVLLTFLRDDQKLIAGFRLKGLGEFGTDLDSAKTAYLNGKSISAITKDNCNGFWFGTLEDGIIYCPDKKHFSLKLCNDKDGDVIVCTTRMNDSTLLFGTLKGKLISLTYNGEGNIKTKSSEVADKLISVQYIYKLNDSRALVISSEAFSRFYDLKKNSFSGLERKSFKALEYHKFSYYGISIKDVEQYNSSEFKFQRRMSFNDRLTSLVFANDKMYVGGLKGLYEIRKFSEKFNGKPILDLRVEALAFKNGKLFIATKNGGVIVKDGEKNDTIAKENGLKSNICRNLFLNQNEVWVLTSVGLSRISYSGYKQYKIRNYNFAEHIFPEGISKLYFFNNTIVYTDKGDVYFFPENQNKITSPFRISSVLVNGKKRSLKKLKLKYYESDIQINYAALLYQNNRLINYRYKFVNDSLWKYTGNSEVHFPNLASGTYSLILQAKSDKGEWINCEDSLSFTIDKPVWQKWQFIFCEVFIAVCILLLIVRYRYIRILRKEREAHIINNKIHELEVKHLKSQMNPHFIFNSLNTLQRFILEEDTSNAHDYLTKFSGLLRKMLESSTSDSILLSEEIQIINHYIEVEKIRFRNSFEYKIVVHTKDPERIKVPFMLIQPFVENAIWHGLMPKTGERLLTIVFSDLDAERILCTVDDNGVGRNYKNKEINPLKKRSLAIEFISHRLELLKKATGIECSIAFKDKTDDSGNSQGTTVAITIPKLN